MNKRKYIINSSNKSKRVLSTVSTSIDDKLLRKICNISGQIHNAYNIRKNGFGIKRQTTENVDIIPKKDNPGIDIYVKENTIGETIYIPVIITDGGINDTVYNDFYIGKNSSVKIIAGCGIHNCSDKASEHDGIHTFNLDENSKVEYVEKHYAQGDVNSKKVLNPKTIINLKKGAIMDVQTIQIEGVDYSLRETVGNLDEDSSLTVSEKIMTTDNQYAKTIFNVKLNGSNSSTHVVSRSVAKDNSIQEFVSNVEGNEKCYGHVECDAIVMDNAKIKADPKIEANVTEARLIHEAAIGKIAGEQLTKLMTLGLSENQAQKEIINGFLK